MKNKWKMFNNQLINVNYEAMLIQKYRSTPTLSVNCKIMSVIISSLWFMQFCLLFAYYMIVYLADQNAEMSAT